MLSQQVVYDSATLWTVAQQAPLSMGSSRNGYCSGLPFPSPGNRPEPGIKLASPVSSALAGEFFTAEPPGKPLNLPYYSSDVQAGFRKGRGTRDQIANILWIIEKARQFWANIYYCFKDSAKGFDCVDHNKLWKILKEMGIPDHLTCLLRNLYTGQEATVKTGHGTTD